MINLVTIEIIIYIITVLFSIVLFICTMLYIKNHKCKSSILSVKEMLNYNICVCYIIISFLSVIPFYYFFRGNALILNSAILFMYFL